MQSLMYGNMVSGVACFGLGRARKIIAQQRKKETKLRITKLAERKRQEQEVAMQRKAAKAATIAQTTENTTMPTEETEEG